MDLVSLEVEQYLLSGILRHPETFAEIDGYINQNDFSSPLHQTIFGVIQQTIRNQQKLDKVLLADKIERYALSFEDKISSVLDYLNSISLIQVKASAVKSTAEELKMYSLRREMSGTFKQMDEAAHDFSITTPNELIGRFDEIYHQKISLHNLGEDAPENIFDGLESVLDYKGKNQQENIGFVGPHNLINQMYGSLLRPSNITTICSRAGGGKTTFMTDYCDKVSEAYNVPIIHFDNGEMPKEELQMRRVAALTGVPFYEIETGKFANDDDKIKIVKETVKNLKNRRFYYYNVAGKQTNEIISLLRRFYMSKIGRDKPAIFCFDYIKSTSEMSSFTKAEWEVVGHLVTKFKDFIMNEVKIPMMTAVQANRVGIITNKQSKLIIDDESVFAGGDRSVFFSSHAFILRRKTYDENEGENKKYGTHKLINVKARHLGKEVGRATKLVNLPGGKKANNYINLDIQNFAVKEVGDLVDMTQNIGHLDIKDSGEEEELLLE